MRPDSRTLVLITIDAEPSQNYENGCFSYCVNGRWPDRLEDWHKLQITVPTRHGYAFTKASNARLVDYQGAEKSSEPALTSGEVAARISGATAGLPSIFDITTRYSAPCTTFLDVSQLYVYGERWFREACDLVTLSDNDLQLHFHPNGLTADWYFQRDLEKPNHGEVQDWPYRTLEAVHKIAAEDLARFSNKRPTAYRAGAYRISNALIDALVNLGFDFDFSYDLLNKKGNVRFDPSQLNGNAPVHYRGLIEIPITAFAYRSAEKKRRFVANPHKYSRIDALKAYRASGLRVISYILHSYSLMRVYGDRDSGRAKVGRLGLDKRSVENFEAELSYMKQSDEFQFVDVAGLKAAIEHDPSILEGPAPFVVVP